MNGLFITGTDTDIGKTALSALLLAELRRRKINAAPMKPAQTGCEGGVPDLDYSLSMAQMAVSDEDYTNMSPYRFEPACSPHLAAEMAGTEIEISEMVIAARKLASDYEFVIAEGAGGVVVPLNRRETMLDLMQALKFPILLAARPGLGTINHTLLSLRALRSDGLDLAGIVFVASKDQEFTFIEEDNGTTIEQFGKVPVLGTIPYCPQLADPTPNYNDLPIPVVAETEKIVNQLAI
ncbi:ATP-dependent dethiobiotin synthetase BioD 1 [Pontiella desulfatans]|uniref:ATP-dependent dethiobiotin synthetase BioD n=1 Tax=Pontiella desulfatans TaxID=2750659 RepID=A0A6C2U9S1_PONDE|nr:dethiobiotin synthase [Pontiella desulfatans]VGO16790.1 ATP-dependent dethiobiotin synthetase BioD 1 [Pontiella desulfatans]